MQFFIKSLLGLPFTPLADGWYFASVYEGSCGGFSRISIHTSILNKGFIPHEIHSHNEAEIFFVLAGALEVVNENTIKIPYTNNPIITEDGFVFFSSDYQHTLHAIGTVDAHYLVIRWKRDKKIDNPHAAFTVMQSQPTQFSENTQGFSVQIIEELQNKTNNHIRAHYSQLSTDAGYEYHKDHYDILMVLFEGSIEIVNRQVSAPSIIFFASGFPHNIKNPGNVPAKYIVFEMED